MYLIFFSFILGIILSYLEPTEFFLVCVILLLAGILLKNFRNIFICVIFFSFGFANVFLQQYHSLPPHYTACALNDVAAVKLILNQNSITKKDKQKAEAEVIGLYFDNGCTNRSIEHWNLRKIIELYFDNGCINSNNGMANSGTARGTWRSTCGKTLLYLSKAPDSSIPYGTTIIVKARFDSIRNFIPDFDYKKFLQRKQIHTQIFVPYSKAIIIQPSHTSLKSTAIKISGQCKNILHKYLSGNELAVVSAMLLGDQTDMDEELRASYRNAGVVHTLCVSGMHLAIFSLILLKVLSFLKRKRILQLIIVCAAIWGYAFITGLGASVMRAATMFTLVALGQCIGRKVTIYRSLTLSAFILFVYNPLLIYDVGLQLSYAAVLGIAVLQPKFQALWKIRKPKSSILKPFCKIAKGCYELTTVSFAAQLFTVPLILYYFKQFPIYFIFGNLIASPLANIILPAGITVCILHFIFSPLAVVAGFILEKICLLLNIVLEWIANLPNAVYFISMSVAGGISLYLAILFFAIALKQRNKYAFYAALCFVWICLIVA
ncbi:MAG: ComEC family competence protein [Bacteroidales bacterium]|jgi:competence protein ComEC|nr:ComEC family competence protein [Bacteroidales bacterium]